MKLITLNKCEVEFNEELHQYHLNGKRLLGITGLIHEILLLGKYADASDFVKKVAIPRAGEYGSSVHKAIENYDRLGVMDTIHANSFDAENPWDVSRELNTYIRHQRGFRPIANEYTVTDGVKWASNIDNVWQREQTDGIWLVDTKTNNLKYYPVDGYGCTGYFRDRVDALKDYLSWQLSIYAELFEFQNPQLRVEGLACNWLREDDGAFWVIPRKPSELVKELLATEYMFGDTGPIYLHPNVSKLGVHIGLTAPGTSKAIVATEVIEYVADLIRQHAELSAKLDEAKKALRKAMEAHELKKVDLGKFTATIAADSTASSFDSAAFKAAYPKLYNQFIKTTAKKGGFTIKTKDK